MGPRGPKNAFLGPRGPDNSLKANIFIYLGAPRAPQSIGGAPWTPNKRSKIPENHFFKGVGGRGGSPHLAAHRGTDLERLPKYIERFPCSRAMTAGGSSSVIAAGAPAWTLSLRSAVRRCGLALCPSLRRRILEGVCRDHFEG